MHMNLPVIFTLALMLQSGLAQAEGSLDTPTGLGNFVIGDLLPTALKEGQTVIDDAVVGQRGGMFIADVTVLLEGNTDKEISYKVVVGEAVDGMFNDGWDLAKQMLDQSDEAKSLFDLEFGERTCMGQIQELQISCKFGQTLVQASAGYPESGPTYDDLKTLMVSAPAEILSKLGDAR